MPDALDKKALLFQTLKDAGCKEEEIHKCLLQMQNGKIDSLRPFLISHKQHMMSEIHTKQKEVDCVDYLLYQIEKKDI